MAEQNGHEPPAGSVRIIIDFNPQNGEIGIVGPLENPTLFLGMLETAKLVMAEQRAKASAPKILQDLPRLPIDLNAIRNKGN